MAQRYYHSSVSPLPASLPDTITYRSSWLEKVVFLGTGTSGQVPAIHCVLNEATARQNIPSEKTGCDTCQQAMSFHTTTTLSSSKGGEEEVIVPNRNRRGCTSIIVQGTSPKDQKQKTFLIDCGKTFYSAALTHFPKHDLRKIDAVLLTHGHADAVLGLDDLRSWTMGGIIQDVMHIYLTQECYDVVSRMFPYLVDRTQSTGGGDVGTLRFHILENVNEPFEVEGCLFTPIPVHHGFSERGTKPYWSLGFRFDTCSYISDCNYIPPSSTDLLKDTECLILDGLKWQPHASHFSIPQALSYTLALPQPLPKQTYLIDFTHRVEHYSIDAALLQWTAGLRQYASQHVREGKTASATWWTAAWSEAKSHQDAALSVQVPTSDQTTADESSSSDAARLVPDVRASYDGQVIHFQPHA